MLQQIKKLKYDEGFIKRFRSIFELVITLPLGAIIAYVFDNQIEMALRAIAVLIVLFILYCIVVVILENKVSVLSIMSEGLRDGRYEDVIKFGSAMSPTLFSSNKNLDRVKLGRVLYDACNKLAQTEHSAREGIVIPTSQGPKTVKQIKIELLLDDLGWSLYLTDPSDNEATSNIQEAIRLARLEIKNIKSKNKNYEKNNEILENIAIYMRLIMRGYRHLTGIYYSDQKTLDLARDYEKVTKYIISEGRVLSCGGVCSSRDDGIADNCGMICSKGNDKLTCILSNIKNLFLVEGDCKERIPINEYIDINRLKLNVNDLIEDKDNFSLLLPSTKEKILKEQSYSWSRNIVKWLQKNIHTSWEIGTPTKGETNIMPFVSDEERTCKISEARAFARLYYYGLAACNQKDYNDFNTVINTELIKIEQQRYLSLMNEISLIDFNRQLLLDEDVAEPVLANDSYNGLIEVVIDHIRRTRDACKGLRADLFARNTSMLMKALYIQYNLNIRYNMGDENTNELRRECINRIRTNVKSLYSEVTKYEHRDNEEVKLVRNNILRSLSLARRELHDWKFVNKNKAIIPSYISSNNVKHFSYADDPSPKVVESIKRRWKADE